MRRSLLLAVALFFAISANAQNTAQKDSKTPKENQCSVAGAVVAMAGSVPLKKARLSLLSTTDGKARVSAVTTADGHFTLKGVDPGAYRLTVERMGYVRQEYGQRAPEARGAVLTLQTRQHMKDLLFRMIPAGVISGKILDEDGDPLPGVTVEALQQSYTEGKRNRQRTHTAESNDLGEYRLYGLWPGRYYVSSSIERWNNLETADEESPPGEEQVGYAKMYYPGTPDAGKASFLTVKPGDEIPSVDILMRKVPVHSVHGHVINQVTHKSEAQTQVLLVPRAKGQFDWQSVAELKADGSFTIRDVLPGAYALIAFWYDEDTNYMNRQSVDAGETDVDGVSIAIVPGVNIPGRIIWDGQPSVEKGDLSLYARAVELPFGFRGYTRVLHDYIFTMKQVSEGTYGLNVNGLSKDCYIKEVRYGTSTSEKNEFTVMRGESRTLEVTVSSKGARVQGTVLDADGLPQPGLSVVLIPEASRRETFSLYHVESTDQYGHFEVRGIAPGDYKLFSWEEVEADAWQDPEFLRPFETKGESVRLEDGDQKTVKITAIKTKEPGTEKP